MRSFVVLGDNAVCEFEGSELQQNFEQLTKHQPPRIYEGAAFAGMAIEQALVPLDLQHRLRICRYHTPLDGIGQKRDPYPFGRFVNFDASSDPLRHASIKWEIRPCQHVHGAPSRLRLFKPESLPNTPFGVHPRNLLESLRPGGAFEYSDPLRQERDHLNSLRESWLKFAALQAVKKAMKGTKVSVDKIIALESSLDADIHKIAKKTKIDATSKVQDSWFKASLKDLLVRVAEMSRKEENLQYFPDVLVLYDLYNLFPASFNQHATGLRSVPLPGEFHGEIGAVTQYQVEETAQDQVEQPAQAEALSTEANDAFVILKAWIGHTYAYLLDGCDQLISAFATSIDLPAEVRRAIRRQPCESICKQITLLYVENLINPSLDSEHWGDLTRPWNRYVGSEEWLRNGAGDTQITEDHRQGKERNEVFDAVIRLSLARLSQAESRTSKQSKMPTAIPLIICCLKTIELPNVTDESNQTDYLTMLYRSPWLRDRTVIILDADNLRHLIHDPAGISSETSWEETAMDTVDAFHHRDRLRPYLDFGFVVIRYGLTGALLLSRQAGGELAVRLFFDARRNDRDWTRPDSGELLGYTSIFAASIVQAITKRCEEREKQPVYGDITDTLHYAIGAALLRCQRFYAAGYGPEKPSAEWQFKGIEELFVRNGVDPHLYDLIPSPSDVFASQNSIAMTIDPAVRSEYLSEVERLDRTTAKWLSSSTIPSVRSQRWSIVEQACVTDMESVAFDVANRGIDRTLNQRVPTVDDVITTATLSAIESVYCEATEQRFDGASDAKAEFLKIVRQQLEKVVRERRQKSELDADDKRRIESVLGEVTTFVAAVAETVMLPGAWENVSPTQRKPTRRLIDSLKEMGKAVREAMINRKVIDFWRTQRRKSYSAPVARFGSRGSEILVVDRREVEGISAVQRLISHYVHEHHGKKAARPLSIAVFGPPGSGKSTAVKCIAKAHENKIISDNLEFNMAQFADIEKLNAAFIKVAGTRGNIPLVFFDEFDSKVGSTDFGWLKFFLAPMEDGKWGEVELPPAIIIFAGGTSYSFSAFSPKYASPSDERWLSFSRAKGPDFVSRLSGHLNIIGVDPTDPDDGLYLLRRAILIRSILERRGAVNTDDLAMVDDPRVLRALLHAPSYRYGGRSLRMLIEACQGSDKWIRRSNIPAAHELEMMVDSKSFLATLRDKWR